MFREFLKDVEPVRIKEPLAETLGAIFRDESTVEFSYTDVVKMTGHACPTTAGAYLSCRKALARLYPGEVPVRGEIKVSLDGEQDEGVYGVAGQVFSLLTGAAPSSGFRGLGHKFRRKDLLVFRTSKGEDRSTRGMRFEFRRQDTGKSVVVEFRPALIPFSSEKSKRMRELLEKVLWDAAKPEEQEEFKDLWMEKVKSMLIEEKGIDQWLKIEEGYTP